MKFAHRMIKMFYGTLDMKNNMDFPHLNTMNDNGVSICVQKSRYPSGQEDMIVNVATSFWLPLSPQIVFDFLKDNTKRPQVGNIISIICFNYFIYGKFYRIINLILSKTKTKILQWDVLCRAYPAHEIQRIINGTNPENYTSIIRVSNCYYRFFYF